MATDTATRHEPALQGWQPIETAPKDWFRNNIGRCLIGHWYEPKDEDGEPDGEGQWRWVHVASLSTNAWHVGTDGFAGVHGFASFPLHNNATHWMPIPPLPLSTRGEAR